MTTPIARTPALATATVPSAADASEDVLAALRSTAAFELNIGEAAVSEAALKRAGSAADAAYFAFLEQFLAAVDTALLEAVANGARVGTEAFDHLEIVPGAQPKSRPDAIAAEFARIRGDMSSLQGVEEAGDVLRSAASVLACKTRAFVERTARPLGISLVLPEQHADVLPERGADSGPASTPASPPAAAPPAPSPGALLRAAPSAPPRPAPGVTSVASNDPVVSAERAVWAALTGFRADFHAVTAAQMAKLSQVVVLGRVVDARGKAQPMQLGYDSKEREHGIWVGDHDFYDITSAGTLRKLLERNVDAGIPIAAIITTLFADVAEHLRAAGPLAPTLYTWPRTPVDGGLGPQESRFIRHHANAFRERFATRIPSLANPTLRECAIDGVILHPTSGKPTRAALLFERGNLWLALGGHVAADLIQPTREMEAILTANAGGWPTVARAVAQMMDEAARKFIAQDVENLEAPRAPQRAALLAPPPASATSAVPVAQETRRVRAGTAAVAPTTASTVIKPWLPPALADKYVGVYDEERDIRALFDSFEQWAAAALRKVPDAERAGVVARLPSGGDNIDLEGNFGPIRVLLTQGAKADVLMANGCMRRSQLDPEKGIERYVRAYNTQKRSVAAVALQAFRSAATAIEARVSALLAPSSSTRAADVTPAPAARLPLCRAT